MVTTRSCIARQAPCTSPQRRVAHRDARWAIISPSWSVAQRVGACTSRCLPTPQRKSLGVVRASASYVNGHADGKDVLEQVQNVVIIGSGPAGYTAAIYAARANLRPLVFEGFQAGGVRGGQLMTTTEVENFPGFPEGISGPELMDRMRSQAERWGAELLTEDVEDVDLSMRPFVIRGSETVAYANSVIIATGATAKRLNLPNEHTFWSRGISACAICDGASPMFKGQEVAVVGGGDTACEEAVYLTKYAKQVHLLVRSSKFRASKAMADRAASHPNVTVHFNTVVQDAYPDPKGAMGGLLLQDVDSGATRKLPVKGLFYGIGHTPNSAFLNGQVETDATGYVTVHEGCKTNVEGVFAAGDLFDTEWRQAITAAGSGCMAALSVERYLTANDLLAEAAPAVVERAVAAVPEKELALVGAATGQVTMVNGAGASAAAVVQEQAAPSTTAPSPSTAAAVPAATPNGVDLSATRHRGQYALRKLYHESQRLIAVMYVSPTCGPCRTLKPIFNKVIDEFAEEMHLVEIDIEEDPEIAQAAGVSGTPTVQFFKNKDRIVNLPGVKMKKEYRAIIEQNL